MIHKKYSLCCFRQLIKFLLFALTDTWLKFQIIMYTAGQAHTFRNLKFFLTLTFFKCQAECSQACMFSNTELHYATLILLSVWSERIDQNHWIYFDIFQTSGDTQLKFHYPKLIFVATSYVKVTCNTFYIQYLFYSFLVLPPNFNRKIPIFRNKILST